MRTVAIEEMKKVYAGATYSEACSYCSEVFNVEYTGPWNLNTAILTAGILLKKHILNEHYNF